MTGVPTGPQAVALLIKVPWYRANEPLHLIVELLDSNDAPVEVQGPSGPQRIAAKADLEVGRPVGLAAGTRLDASMALNFPPMPLAPGGYRWRATIGGDVQEEWFTVRG